MQNLIRFFLRYHFFILFLLLEGLSFGLVVAHHRDGGRFLNSANSTIGVFYSGIDAVFGYIHLKEENYKLAVQNTKLLSASRMAMRVDTAQFWQKNDSVLKQQYEYMAAEIVNNSIHKQRNFITINKGRKQGVRKDMAVISSSGVVGVVIDVSNHYALVISMLNVDVGVSAKLKGAEFFGSVNWNGRDPLIAELKGIPSHAELAIGDTVITSGYSSIFPQEITIGRVLSFQHSPGTKRYNVLISFSEDFSSLKQVYVVKNLLRSEQLELEEVIK